MDIISRQEAKANGLSRYFTSEVCKLEHRVERYVSSGECVICASKRGKKRYEENSEEIKISVKKYYETNTEKVKLNRKQYLKNNTEKVKLYRKQYLKNNAEKVNLVAEKYKEENWDEIKLYQKKYREDNVKKFTMYKTRRRALKRGALDVTIPNEKFEEIEKRKSNIAETTGIPHHTDHFIPLSKGGMHTPSNLRIIPATVNLQKHAQIWSEEKLIQECRVYYEEQGLPREKIEELMSGYSPSI